jgi:hypothetical protein
VFNNSERIKFLTNNVKSVHVASPFLVKVTNLNYGNQ